MGQITLQGVRKSFGPVNIIKDANLDIEDGSFVRIQNVTIGYTFDLPKFTGAARRSRVYLSADNLALFTNYTGYDPEVHTDASIERVATRGIDYLHYPRPRTFTGGLRVQF